MQLNSRIASGLHSKHFLKEMWNDKDTLRTALEAFGLQYGVKQLDDWYPLVNKSTVKKQLSFVQRQYGSLFAALKNLYPHHDWNPHKLSLVPKGYWKDTNNQRDALERFGREHGVKELDDWYKLNSTEISNELIFITKYYNHSVFAALKALYPQHNWDPLKLSKVPSGYWKDLDSQRDAFEKFGREHGVKQLDDWYRVNTSKADEKVSSIINHHGSLYATLKKLYPQHNWDPHRLSKAPNGYWNDVTTQRNALEKFGREHGVKELDDWYKIYTRDVSRELSFVRNYHVNLCNALTSLYPQHNWDPLKFARVHHNFWKDEQRQQHYHSLFHEWKKKYRIRYLTDWYNLPPQQLKLFQRASRGIFGSVTKMLKEWFPETQWSNQIQSSTAEFELQMMLKLVTDDLVVHHRIGKHSVDIFVPEWDVAIEYQGVQHYQQNWRGDFVSQLKRDEEKQKTFSQKIPISLIPINYQWNGTWSQLKSTLKKYQNM